MNIDKEIREEILKLLKFQQLLDDTRPFAVVPWYGEERRN